MYREVHPVQILDYAADVDYAQEAVEIDKAEDFYQQQQIKELSDDNKMLPAQCNHAAVGGEHFCCRLNGRQRKP